MNKVFLMGRLTDNPALKSTPNGTSVASFTLAVDRRFSKENQVDFIRCTAWRQTAEFICKYFKKGSMICTAGSIRTRSWDGADGKKQYATDIMVEEAYFTGSKSEGGAQTEKPAAEEYTFDDFNASGFMQPDFDDLP